MRARITCWCFVLGAILATTMAQKPTTKPAPKRTTKPPPTPDKLQCTVFNATVKLITTAYTETLKSSASADFINLRLEVEAGVMQVYENEKAFVGVSVMKYDKTADGKTKAAFVVEFNTNATHLAALLKQLATKKLGKLDVDAKFVKYACYIQPPPPTCVMPCPSLCAPSCGSSCCNQYSYPVYAPPPPPPPPQPIMLAPPPQVAPCPPTCAPACAPACSPTCCSNTNYYGKRHQTHPEKKDDKKKNKKISKD